jgi:hypothetical protein
VPHDRWVVVYAYAVIPLSIDTDGFENRFLYGSVIGREKEDGK